MIVHLGALRNQGARAPVPTPTGSGIQNCQPMGGGPHAGSGTHPGGGLHPGGESGQLDGGLKRMPLPGADVRLMKDPLWRTASYQLARPMRRSDAPQAPLIVYDL